MTLIEQLKAVDISSINVLFIGESDHSCPYTRFELGKVAKYLQSRGFNSYGAEAPISSKPSFDALSKHRTSDIDYNVRWGPILVESRQQYAEQGFNTNRAMTYQELAICMSGAGLEVFPFDIREESNYAGKSMEEQEIGLADTIETKLREGRKVVILIGELHTGKERTNVRQILHDRGYKCLTVCFETEPNVSFPHADVITNYSI